MKTTNYRISKKLKEIGFDAETKYYWHDINCNLEVQHVAVKGLGDYKSYGLETLIEALPKVILFKKEKYYYWMRWSESSDCLLMGYVNATNNRRAIELEVVWLKENESLADTAGRLIINLFEASIINNQI